MAKPERGTKRQCPKCGTRFYDLGKDNPVTCISCGHSFQPEPILKSRRPREEAAPEPAEQKETSSSKEAAGSSDVDVAESGEAESGEEVIGLEEAEEGDDVSDVINPQVDDDT